MHKHIEVVGLILALLCRASFTALAYSIMGQRCNSLRPGFLPTQRSVMSMKRGRGSFQRETGSENDNSNGPVGTSISGFVGSSSSSNWLPLPVRSSQLPTQEGQVTLLDTQLPTLKNAATNPTGAVGVVKYDSQYYCFEIACPSCKIPLTKAKMYPPIAAPATSSDDDDDAIDETSPRLTCDFCKATYQVKDGQKVASADSGGFFGGMLKSIYGSQQSGPLRTYKLGEKSGQLLISFD